MTFGVGPREGDFLRKINRLFRAGTVLLLVNLRRINIGSEAFRDPAQRRRKKFFKRGLTVVGGKRIFGGR